LFSMARTKVSGRKCTGEEAPRRAIASIKNNHRPKGSTTSAIPSPPRKRRTLLQRKNVELKISGPTSSTLGSSTPSPIGPAAANVSLRLDISHNF
jgi:hypothetical protein